MSNMETLNDLKPQKGLIITDDIAINPILDFNLYCGAIVDIIRNSHPKFTIGVFGDWGSGKTTLMDAVRRILEPDKKNIVTVQFETWRYEREEQFALIPLLKTIAFALPDEQKFEKLREKLKRGATNLLKRTPDIASAIVSKFLGEQTGEISKNVIESFKREFNSKVELLAEVDRDTLYFDGFEDIKKELKKIIDENRNFRIVVFVDDLDRCSPKKTLEVLESIKVFLGMEGFIYVIGISHDVVTKLIDIEYEKSGVKGEQYIKKMIQIPITLPKWDHEDISKLVSNFIEKDVIHEKYKATIKENIELISKAVEYSPRELKRFLNNFIVAYEIFSKKEGIKLKELLLIQAIQIRWNDFYDLLVKLGTTLTDELKKYLTLSDEDRIKKFESEDKDANLDYNIRLKLRDYKSDIELWEFLKNENNFRILHDIKDFTPYRRATESTIDISRYPIPRHIEERTKIDFENLSRELDEVLLLSVKLRDDNPSSTLVRLLDQIDTLRVELGVTLKSCNSFVSSAFKGRNAEHKRILNNIQGELNGLRDELEETKFNVEKLVSNKEIIKNVRGWKRIVKMQDEVLLKLEGYMFTFPI